MSDKNKISVIIVTYNESKRIRRCLESVKWADEIVVVDQSSLDGTAAICREYTDKVYVVPNKGFCEPDRPVALSKTSNDWVLYLDADEIVSVELRQEIESTPAFSSQCECYYVARRNIYIGKWVKHSGWYPSRVLRLFKKDKVTFSDNIHTDVMPKGICGYLKNDLIHYTYESVDEHVTKMIRYTGVTASQLYAKGERITAGNFFWKLFLLPVIYFFHRYVWLRGYGDGIRGLLIGAFTLAGVFATGAKLWELQNREMQATPNKFIKNLKAVTDIFCNFIFLVPYKKINLIYSDTGYSDLHGLFLLARDGAGCGAIVEIGAYKGKSAVVMALGSKAKLREKVYSIDPHIEGTKAEFTGNVRRFALEDRIDMIEATSESARRAFDLPIRLLFIDGCHEYDFVKMDILLWKDLVIDGGVIVFHDINWGTVARAVDELIRPSREFVVECYTGCSLIVSKGFSANKDVFEEIKLFNMIKETMLLRKRSNTTSK